MTDTEEELNASPDSILVSEENLSPSPNGVFSLLQMYDEYDHYPFPNSPIRFPPPDNDEEENKNEESPEKQGNWSQILVPKHRLDKTKRKKNVYRALMLDLLQGLKNHGTVYDAEFIRKLDIIDSLVSRATRDGNFRYLPLDSNYVHTRLFLPKNKFTRVQIKEKINK